jgi:hypothetical protein
VPSGRGGKSRSDLPLLFFELYFKTMNNVGDEEAYTNHANSPDKAEL